TATNAPAIPCARMPMPSKLCARASEGKPARSAHTTDTKVLAIRLYLSVLWLRVGRRVGLALTDEHRRRNDGGPPALFVADGGLRDVLGADDLIGQPVDFFFLVPALVGVELE